MFYGIIGTGGFCCVKKISEREEQLRGRRQHEEEEGETALKAIGEAL